MKKFLFVLCLAVSTSIMPQGTAPLLEEQRRHGVSLLRVSLDRIVMAQAHYKRRMNKARAGSTLLVFGVPLFLIGSAWGIPYARRKYYERKNAADLKAVKKRVEEAKLFLQDERTPENEADQLRNLETLQGFRAEQARLEGEGGGQAPQAQASASFWRESLKFGCALGIAGVVMSGGHQLLRVFSGTIDEMIQLWWRGYEYWYVALEEQAKGLMEDLVEVLFQARRMTQQTTTEQQLLAARQQRYGQVNQVSASYRHAVVKSYQVLVPNLERITALMFIIAPGENHMLIRQQFNSFATKLDKLAEALEVDLNDNVQGLPTHYSNNSLDACHEVRESMTLFLSTFRTYLKK